MQLNTTENTFQKIANTEASSSQISRWSSRGPVLEMGRHQIGRDDGAEVDPGRILPGVHMSVEEKSKNVYYTLEGLI